MTQTTADAGRTDSCALIVREIIDQIDETPFGKVEKLMDHLAECADAAVKEHAHLLSVIDGMVLVCGRTGDAFYDFEEQAEVFQRETGWMRPGKSMPMEMSRDGGDDHEARRIKYNTWVQTKIELARAALAAAKGSASSRSTGEP